MDKADLQSIMRGHFPFDLLTETEFEKITERSEYTTFSKNELLFHEDESNEDLNIYFLVAGLAKNVLHRNNGKQFSLRYYYPGDIVGLMMMLTSGKMTFSVQALEDCTAFQMNKADFFEVMTENKDFSKIIFESIGNRMKTLYDEIKFKSSDDDDENIALFRTRVKSHMDSPQFIHPDESMITAAKKLKQLNIKGLIVSQNHQLEGIISQEELINYLICNDQNSHLVKDWMKSRPLHIHDDAFTYEAMSLFKHHDVHYVPVTHQNDVVGILTSSSFLNLQGSNYLDLAYKVNSAQSAESLKPFSSIENRIFHNFLNDLLSNDSFAYDVSEVITNYNDILHRKVIKVVEAEMIQEGYGPPPINYCFIVMGSQGRKEQGLRTDQDNGLILSDYDHLKNKEQIDTYFQVFSNKVNTLLAIIGFPECTGGIMAKNDNWRNSLHSWKEIVKVWLTEMNAEEILNFTMFYDFRPIMGDFSLAEDLRVFTTEKVKRSLNLQQLLMKDTIRFRIPINALGRINLTRKSKMLNVKKVGIMQIINNVRINSIKYGVQEVNTIKRLQALKELKVFHPRDVDNLKLALHHLLSLRLKRNLEELEKGMPLSNELEINTLSKEERRQVKDALSIANRMQQATEISFNRNRVV